MLIGFFVNFQANLHALTISDTQEAAKCLPLEGSSSLESLDSEPSDSRAGSPPPTATPTLAYPTWRPVIGNQILGRSSTGAFSTYARTRGEPDGRTATMGSDQKGRESDTFTPSPVDTMKPFIGGRLLKQSPQPSPHLAINLSHQSKIRCMYNDSPPSDNNGARPDSSSSAGSVNDWDSGQTTVRRQVVAREVDDASSYAGVKKGMYNLGLGENNSSMGSLLDAGEMSQANSELDFAVRSSDVRNFSAQSSNFNVPSGNVKSDMKKKSCLFSSIVNKTMGKDLSRKGFSKLDQERNYYKRSATLGHVVETRAQIHHVEAVNRYYPSSETGIYAPCLDGKTQENVDIHEIRVPSTIGCNRREKSLYVPQAFHNSLTGKKDQSGKHILSTQLRHMSQELPDVYHDRNVGLGLAPSLSTILAADNIGSLTENQDLPENNLPPRLINLNSSQKHLQQPRQKPPLPPKRIPVQYNHSHGEHRNTSEDPNKKDSKKSGDSSVRDQGDGGSFTDLNCPSQISQDAFPPSLRLFSSFLNNLENHVLNGSTKESNKKTKAADCESVAAFKPNVINSHDSLLSTESALDSDHKSKFYFSGDEEHNALKAFTKNDEWATDANRNICTSSTTSDTEGSDMDNSKNISTVKRNPKHVISSRKVPENA